MGNAEIYLRAKLNKVGQFDKYCREKASGLH
jgi:hypothetical protein